MIRVAIIQSKVDSGGVKNLVLEYYRHIDREKVQFDLICDNSSNSIPFEEFEEKGGKVYTVTPYKNIIKHTYDVWKILKTNKYEVVHGFDNLMNIFALSGAYFAGTKVRISESLTTAHMGEWKSYVKMMLRPFSKCFANYFLACGQKCGIWQFGQKTFDKGKIHIFKTVINAKHNAYNKKLREETRKKYGWENSVVYGFIGRITMQKNPSFLVDIFGEILKKQKNARLAIIGWGNMQDEILNKIKLMGIEGNVDFLGRREDIQQFYNAFDAFLLPSFYEGLPLVGLESQSAGLPVFFSSEVTEEVAVCDLSHFIPLDKGAEYWANVIVEETAKNIPQRRSHAEDVINNGFDSESEARRLQEFYFNAIREQSIKS